MCSTIDANRSCSSRTIRPYPVGSVEERLVARVAEALAAGMDLNHFAECACSNERTIACKHKGIATQGPQGNRGRLQQRARCQVVQSARRTQCHPGLRALRAQARFDIQQPQSRARRQLHGRPGHHPVHHWFAGNFMEYLRHVTAPCACPCRQPG